jgi:hypothetical protein
MPWDSGVNPPAGGRYTGSLVDFSALSNWGPDDPAKLRKEQEAKAFQQGLPIDPRTGQTDAKAVAATALKFPGLNERELAGIRFYRAKFLR